MECWSIGILGVPAEINHFNCKKFLQNHQSITPLFHHSLPGGGPWGEALNLHYTNSIILTSIFPCIVKPRYLYVPKKWKWLQIRCLYVTQIEAKFFKTIFLSKCHPFNRFSLIFKVEVELFFPTDRQRRVS